jgi:NitT/TauT family transport system substrate-binding protein
VAAIFQKDPSVLIAHPGRGNDSLAALKGKPIMIGADTRVGWWLFLKSKFGYSDDQIRPYTFNVAPFLADKSAVQQGYLTSEPFTIAQQGVEPVVMLIADAGYSSYGSLIQTSRAMIEHKPELVQRFVDASIEGWASYLHGDPSPANALIKKDNPEMTDALLAYAVAKIKQYGIVDSGDARTHGIGAMSDARWQDFYKVMAEQGLYPKDMDYGKAYTLQFVNKRLGADPARR